MGEPISDKLPILSFNSNRRFGLELEILAFDKRNRPVGGEKEKPAGTDYVVNLVKKHSDENVEWRHYEHTNENNVWVVKPDSSCGLEVCSPIYRNWRGIRKVCQVVDAFGKDPLIEVDQRCSVHVHVEVADLTEEQIASIIINWVKCEAIFLDMVPPERKMNRYCQFMGMRDLFDTEIHLSAREIILRAGDVKYYTANSNQYVRTNGKRKTLEFRIIEGNGCKDPYLIKNWLRLILHFVEMMSNTPLPYTAHPYVENDPWVSWVCILDTKDVLRLLGFHNDPYSYELSKGLTQTRNWMLARLSSHMTPDLDGGPRWKAYNELLEVMDKFEKDGVDLNQLLEQLYPSDLSVALYDDGLRF
jgi:hypothetical protein